MYIQDLGLPQLVAFDSPCGRLNLPLPPSEQDLVPVPGMHNLKNQAPMGVVEYDYAHETSYNDALKSRSLLKQAFKKYVDKVNSIMKNDDRCVKLLHFKVEVAIEQQYEE